MNETGLLHWLNTLYPDSLPNKEVTSYELGKLVGQREVIEQLNIKFKIEEIVNDIIK